MPALASRVHRRALGRSGGTVLLAVALVLAGAGCQLRTDVNLTVEADGSGEVEVVVALDDDAVEQNPGLLEGLEFTDLVEAGWEVTGPDRDDDGFTRLRVRHGFGAPEEISGLVDQVSGEDGPFRDFAVVRDDAFAETRYRFEGVVDFGSGVRSLTDDPELAEALDADPVDIIEDRIGGAVDQILRFQVAVRLPGDVESNAPTQASNGAVWQPSVLERDVIQLSASSSIRRSERLVWSALAAVAGFALVLLLAIRLVSWRRSKATIPSS